MTLRAAVGLRSSTSPVLVVVASALIGAACLSCGEAPGDPPAAVIEFSPAALCLHDGFVTQITLDGSKSTAHLTLVPAPPAPDAQPLTMRWTLSGSAVRLVEGELTGPRLVVTAAGDRPLHVALTVRNGDGVEADATLTIPVSVPPPWPPCGDTDDCLPGTTCVAVHDQPICVDATPCAADRECDPCSRCDEDRKLCVPRRPAP